MSYTPKLTLTKNSQWKFAPDDLAGICLQPGGCGVTHPTVCPNN